VEEEDLFSYNDFHTQNIPSSLQTVIEEFCAVLPPAQELLEPPAAGSFFKAK
jgi:hypothetical protein